MKNLEKHYVGVDCHKDSIACYINGKFKEFKTDFKGFVGWAYLPNNSKYSKYSLITQEQN